MKLIQKIALAIVYTVILYCVILICYHLNGSRIPDYILFPSGILCAAAAGVYNFDEEKNRNT